MPEALTKAGRYQIVGELGRGSMGVVYRGFDPVIGRTVAIKTMLPEGLSPQEFEEYKARFQREAMAAGILAHPNIITIYDFGEDNGILYLAMEFLEGKSLEKIVQERTVLPLETILPIFDQICSALDHAHQNKIVHRDIKPANIMILQNGLVKVTDFGIAKIMALGMTQAGQVLGTPNYMSPEQVKGRQIDGRSDIFSLGVILYELVTGEKPFAGQNLTTVIYKIIHENPIPPRELDASIHSGLNYIISKALAKNVDERYQTCHELAEDLRNYKSLSSAIPGQGTAMLRVPTIPVEPPEPAPLPVAEPPAEVAPPPLEWGPFEGAPVENPSYVSEAQPPEARPGIPQIAYVVGALLILGILGSIGYLVFLRPRPRAVATTAAPQLAAQVAPAAVVSPPPPIAAVATAPVPVAAAEPPAAKPAVALTREPPNQSPSAKAGQLTVSANVAGATIFVDGRSDPTWLTPHTIPDIPAGAHNVEISMNGYETFSQSVTVEAGQTSNINGTLSAPRAELDIVTTPAGAEVTVDGKSYGPSPVRAILEPGTHTYTVKQPGAPPFQNSVVLKSGEIITKMLSSGVAAPTGIVEVRTTPPGATVTADGAPVGSQTPTSFRLPVGTHTLVVSLTGHPPQQKQITVSANGTTTASIDLTSQ